MAKMGRDAIFRDKNLKDRVQAPLTDVGRVEFERGRTALAALYKHIMGRPWGRRITDADTIEYLARGVDKTTRYLGKRRQEAEGGGT